ncbi:MAG: hypothetical protein WCS73_06850 [Lentisphaeria bacterium]
MAKRIANIYNFVRDMDPRLPDNGRDLLFHATKMELFLLKKYNMPSTFALQYDALINDKYQKLFKDNLNSKDEIGAWWEIVQPQAESAGLKWRGRFPWDWHTNIGFSVGYTPKERERLVDVYMDKFKSVFDYYPQTVGSWFIDAHSLNYMYEKYGVLASCNCKDQIGTDGYTLWGGYWNQAYYPSKKNAYMPAQTIEGQIPIPIFRMLGSDPIYQYDVNIGQTCQEVITLEPVYTGSLGGGGNAKWVHWFLGLLTEEPCLAFAYTQIGQENSFTWDKIEKGLNLQIKQLDKLRTAGKISIETLCESGKWFRHQFKCTPATAFTAGKDWKQKNCRTAWYNCKFYRINILWENKTLRIRDLHLFDEKVISEYFLKTAKTNLANYRTLPVMDGFHWSTKDHPAGIFLVSNQTGPWEPIQSSCDPVFQEPNNTTLAICWKLNSKQQFRCACKENSLIASIPMDTSWALNWRVFKDTPLVKKGTQNRISFQIKKIKYSLNCLHGNIEKCTSRSILFKPGTDGTLVLQMELL